MSGKVQLVKRRDGSGVVRSTLGIKKTKKRLIATIPAATRRDRKCLKKQQDAAEGLMAYDIIDIKADKAAMNRAIGDKIGNLRKVARVAAGRAVLGGGVLSAEQAPE